MDPLEAYLRALHTSHSAGAVPETSGYGALAALLNAAGQPLKPKVVCVIHPGNRGAGIPDGALYSADQLAKGAAGAPLPGQAPARGVVEVKSPGEPLERTAESAQVLRYLARYGQVLVTNYREFLLLGRDAAGAPTPREGVFRLARDEAAFWAAAAQPERLVADQGVPLAEYLQRVLLSNAPLAAPKDVAWFLASYARDAKARVERGALPALATVRAALEGALGLRFEGEKGEHFFRSTLVQTLFYGIFSAWVLWSRAHPPGDSARFHWHEAVWLLHVPMIRALFEQVATPGHLRALDLVEVLDWTGDALNRVDRAAFFARFEDGHAVQYFYEPFLEAFDPELRKDLGVWYTPPEIVQYMVARVDTVLRTELGRPAGLADPDVFILDPACGTGAYLVEVLKRIAATLAAQGGDALSGADLKRAALARVFGFEILPAPFVVAHLQIGLLLQSLGAGLDADTAERAGVYLTNSLTGWEPPDANKETLVQLRLAGLPELREERDAAEEVKRNKPILVILGNPPYNAFAGTSPEEEQGLVVPYKEGLNTRWGIKKFNLDDLYVRFFRLAERRIAESTGQGVVCYISNHSWISDPSFVVLRKHLLDSFDRFWIENMHGNRKISEYAPDGRTSETIFALSGFSPGIQQGVAISLWVKNGRRDQEPRVLFRDDLNAAKASERRAQILESLNTPDFDAQYEVAYPDESNRYSFRPSNAGSAYQEWPRLVELSEVYPFNGPIERRGNSLIVPETDKIDLDLLEVYLDPARSDEEVRAIAPRFMHSSGEFKADKTRSMLKGKVQYDPGKITRYPFKPFDIRLAYLDAAIHPLFSRPSPDLLALRKIPQNSFFITRDTADKDPEGPPFYYSSLICDYDFISGHARHFPIRIFSTGTAKVSKNQLALFGDLSVPQANLSPAARAYLAALGIADPDRDAETAGLIWMHALAVGYAPAYLAENADGIRQDWPRVPLPATAAALRASAALGREVAALLDTEQEVPGVTSGAIRPELRGLGGIARAGGGSLDAGRDLAVTAGWGHGGQNGVTMPGKGRLVARAYTPAERAALGDAGIRLLGDAAYDVYLNAVAYWSTVPAAVWDYTIGGYQVIKKWLSYREQALLGRALTADEARAVTGMVRRLAALLLLGPALDANYARAAGAAYPWRATSLAPATGAPP